MDAMDAPQQPQPIPPNAPAPRRIKRRFVAGLVALHVLSLAAAVFLIARGPDRKPAAEGGGKSALLSLAATKDSVGWVSIRGPIMSSEGGRPWEKGAEQWSRRIEQLANTKGVKAIVLDINSPGGSVGAVQEIHSRILRMKKEKNMKFVALFNDVSASGGYYLGAACDKIVAHPGTITGSIGVIFSVSNLEGLFQKIGYRADPIKSGKHKDIGSPARPMTAEERKILQDLIDDAYGQFVQAVADGRKMPIDVVKPLADGRIYSGSQAKQLGLVDELGDSILAARIAAQLGGIELKDDEKPKIRRDVERLNDIFDLLESRARLMLGVGPAGITISAPSPKGLLYAWSGGW